jgi:hypothetical protein
MKFSKKLKASEVRLIKSGFGSKRSLAPLGMTFIICTLEGKMRRFATESFTSCEPFCESPHLPVPSKQKHCHPDRSHPEVYYKTREKKVDERGISGG